MLTTKTSYQNATKIDWGFDYDICFLFEVPTRSIQGLLPRLVSPYEVRPGVSVLTFGFHCFEKGNLDGTLPEFVEANCGIMVHPLLSATMAPPKFAIYTLYIASNSPAFVQHAANEDKMPVYHASNLQWSLSPDGERVEVWDDHGPMYSMQNTLINPPYEKGDFTAQIFSLEDDNKLYHTVVRWQGTLCEHQHKGKGFGKFYNHPSLKGIEIDEETQTCYMQMFTPVGKAGKGILTYYKPRRLY